MDNQNKKYWQSLVLLLKEIAAEKKISQNDIAEKTGLKQENISRFFSLGTCPSLRIFLSIAQAIGVNFYFEDKDGTSDLNLAFERAMTELGRRHDKLKNN